MRCLARLMRWAIVASGTRNARAISAVVRPPTARSVERELRRRGQRRVAAQEQEQQRVVLVGGVRRRRARRRPRVGGAARRRVLARRRASSLRSWSVSRREPTVISQPAGCRGARRSGHCTRRGQQRLLHGVLARVEVAVAAHERAEDLRRQRPQQVLDAGVGAHMSVGGLVHQRPDLDRAEPGERHLGRDLDRPLVALAVDDVEAAEVLLGLDVRPVGHDGHAVVERDGLGDDLVGHALRADELARGAQLRRGGVGVAPPLESSSGNDAQSSSFP